MIADIAARVDLSLNGTALVKTFVRVNVIYVAAELVECDGPRS